MYKIVFESKEILVIAHKAAGRTGEYLDYNHIVDHKLNHRKLYVFDEEGNLFWIENPWLLESLRRVSKREWLRILSQIALV